LVAVQPDRHVIKMKIINTEVNSCNCEYFFKGI